MPRSFLVKKVKLDEFSAGADIENAYRHRADLSLRLHDKGRSGLRARAALTGVCNTMKVTCCVLEGSPHPDYSLFSHASVNE